MLYYPKHAIRNASLVGGISERCFYKPHNESFESPLKGKHLEEKPFKHNLRVLDNKPLAWIDVKESKEKGMLMVLTIGRVKLQQLKNA